MISDYVKAQCEAIIDDRIRRLRAQIETHEKCKENLSSECRFMACLFIGEPNPSIHPRDDVHIGIGYGDTPVAAIAKARIHATKNIGRHHDLATCVLRLIAQFNNHSDETDIPLHHIDLPTELDIKVEEARITHEELQENYR